MPRYTVGSKTVTSDQPLTEQELDELFADAPSDVRTTQPAPQRNELVESMSLPEKMLVSLGKGMSDIPNGIAQIFGLKSAEDIAEERRLFEPVRQSGGIPAKVSEMVGEALPTIAIPGGVSGNILKRVGTATLAGGSIGAMLPIAPGESRAKNTLVGGVLGGGTTGALGVAGKILNLFKKSPATLGQAHGIRTTLGEDLDNNILKHAESQLEQIPIIGLQGFRKKQQAEAEQAAKNFFGQYVVNPTLETTAAMKSSNDAYINGLYDSVRHLGSTLPSIHPANVKQRTSELLQQYPSIFESIQDGQVKKILKNIAGDVKDTTVNTGVLNAQGQPINRTQQAMTNFDDMWMLRKGLGQEKRDAPTDTAKWVYQQLYDAVNEDMNTMFNVPGSIVGKEFKKANDAFIQYDIKFDVLRQAYDKAMGTTKAGEMFSPKKFSTELKNLANDPQYKKNIKWAPDEVQEMTGLANILQVVKRAGQFAENPPTGLRYGLLSTLTGMGAAGGMAGGVAGGVGAVAGAGTIAGVTTFLTTTQAGKKIARSASKIEPRSYQMKILMDQIYNQLPKAINIWTQKKNIPYLPVTPNPALSE
jgi:hypothetical protein